VRQRADTARRELRLKALLVVIANGPYYGTGFTVAPDAIIDDGLLTISVFRDFSKWELIRHFWSISKGQYYIPQDPTTGCRGTVNIKCKVARSYRRSSARRVTGHAHIKHALKVIVPAADTPTYKRKDDPTASSLACC